MRGIILSACLVLGASGCATQALQESRQSYGNFVPDTPASLDQAMADDAVKQIAAVYPPARTRFDLQHATPDAFGATLVQSLRTRGYALLEWAPPVVVSKVEVQEASADTPASSIPQSDRLPLRYVIDRAGGPDLYWVSLAIGDKSLTRAYLAQNGTLAPAGAWLRRE